MPLLVLTLALLLPLRVSLTCATHHRVMPSLGIDINDNGVYDFDAGASNLDNDLPFEATIPTACGGFELATRRRAAKKIEFDLQPVPHGNRKDGGSAVTGTANVKARGNRLFITMTVEGATPGLPHLQHFHGSLDPGANNSCPDASARNLITDDGLISTAEGAPAYGGILLSLTTEGDMSPDSALDLERFPVADENGRYEYRRIMRVSPEIAQHIENLHLVVHGTALGLPRRLGLTRTRGKKKLQLRWHSLLALLYQVLCSFSLLIARICLALP